MKKKYILVISSIFLIFFVIIFIIKNPSISGYLFFGKHITINLSISLNGEKISLDNLNATCIYEKNDNCTVTSENGTYKTDGGKYGNYEFQIVIPSERLKEYDKDIDKDITLKLNYINGNQWYISESNCIIDLVTDKEGMISGNYKVNVKYNDDTSNNFTDKIELLNDIINISWGI